MDRMTLKSRFQNPDSPAWACPTCSSGLLQIKPGTFFHMETKNSKDSRSSEHFDPDWIEHVYSCILICGNKQCQESVANTGIGFVDYYDYYDDDGKQYFSYADFFRPKYFEPHLRIFNIPETCPDSVSNPLNESFKLFFLNPAAALNSARIAIEELLTALNIKRFDRINGKLRYVNLDARIRLLPARLSDVKTMLLAAKWLGNAGSHPNTKITMDDVLDSYELIAHVLDELYVKKTKQLLAMAKKVNKKRGPIKNRRKQLRSK